MKKATTTAQATTTARAEQRTSIIAFDTTTLDYKGKAVLELSITNVDNETGKQFTYPKYFGILNNEGLDFDVFKAQRVFEKTSPEFKSFAVYGEKGLIKRLQADGKITAEI